MADFENLPDRKLDDDYIDGDECASCGCYAELDNHDRCYDCGLADSREDYWDIDR
jgi:hypothetical protein